MLGELLQTVGHLLEFLPFDAIHTPLRLHLRIKLCKTLSVIVKLNLGCFNFLFFFTELQMEKEVLLSTKAQLVTLNSFD